MTKDILQEDFSQRLSNPDENCNLKIVKGTCDRNRKIIIEDAVEVLFRGNIMGLLLERDKKSMEINS